MQATYASPGDSMDKIDSKTGFLSGVGFTIAIGIVCVVALGCVPQASGQANVQGQWRTLATTCPAASGCMPINPIHSALLHNGKVLIVSGSGNQVTTANPNIGLQPFQAAIYDPATGITATPHTIDWDMFCNGIVILYDGRAFINGGTIFYDNPFEGSAQSSIYDPLTDQFIDVMPNMADGRWYPTVTNLSDGTLMAFSGYGSCLNCAPNSNAQTNLTVEFYTVGSGWSTPYTAPFTPTLYPRMHVIPNGKVFNSGSSNTSRYFDPSTRTWTAVADTNYSPFRTYGSSVLLPLSPANNYKPVVIILGGAGATGADPATSTTELIDLSAASPSWKSCGALPPVGTCTLPAAPGYGPPMSQERIEMNATILPNGKVLVVGGSVQDEDATTASLNTEIYDPASNSFSCTSTSQPPCLQNVYPRLYHSNALLLPDATVMLFGGNPARGTYEPHIEVYSPPYLFNSNGTLATRPTISSVPSAPVGYGAAFQVQTANAASITSVALIRPGAPTHAFDMEQRMVSLNFTAGSGVLNVTAPPNSNIAPPGYYLLFIVNSSGVPSVAPFIQLSLHPTDIPPTGTITSPASNQTITAGQSVNFAGSGTDPDGTISSYAWTFPGGTPGTSALATPGNVVYSTPGTYTAMLTVTDNAGQTDPSPPTRTITVNPSGVGTAMSTVQAADGFQSGQTTKSLAYPATPTAGNTLIVVGISSGLTGTTLSVSDNNNQNWQSASSYVTNPNANGQVMVWFVSNCVAQPTTVTVSIGSSAHNIHLQIFEVSGLAGAPVDAKGIADSGSAAVTTQTATTTSAVTQGQEYNLAASWTWNCSTCAPTITKDPNYSILLQSPNPTGGDFVLSQARIQNAASGTQSVTWSSSIPYQYATVLVTFKGAATSANGAISGTVTDAVTSAAIANATVSYSGGSTTATTNASGGYTLSVAPGTYSVTATAANYQSSTQTGITVNSGASTTANFSLTQNVGTIAGTVTSSTGTPLANATVSYSGGSTTATTNASGAYTLKVAPGTYTVSVTATGYQTSTQSNVTVTQGATTTTNFSLTLTTGTIAGTVTTSTGTAISGATISYSGGSATATTNASGAYTLTVVPGTYSVTAAATGYQSSTQSSITVTANSTTTTNFSLVSGSGTISGTVTSSTGTAISGATVSYSGGATTATTNASGAYTLSVAPGTYSVTAAATGYQSSTTSGVTVTAGTTTTVNFSLAQSGGTTMATVQAVDKFQSGQTSLALAYPKSPTAGNTLIVVGISSGLSGTTLTVSDNNHQTWQSAYGYDTNPNTNGQVQVWYVSNCVGSPTTVTVAIGSTSHVIHMQMFEVSGLTSSPVDATGSADSGSNPTTTQTVTTSAAVAQGQEYNLATSWTWNCSTCTPTITKDPNYTILLQSPDATGGDFVLTQARIQTAASGKQSATFTSSKNYRYASVLITFK